MPLADALTYVPQIPMIRQPLIWPTLVVVQVAALGQLHSFWTLMFLPKKDCPKGAAAAIAFHSRRVRHANRFWGHLQLFFSSLFGSGQRQVFLILVPCGGVCSGSDTISVCFSAFVCFLPFLHKNSWAFPQCAFCVLLICNLCAVWWAKSGCQKSLRRFVPARLSAVFHTLPQPGPPTATPTAFATANYSTRAQWQMELGSCFRAPTNCQLICKANQSALNGLEFSLFWVSVAQRFFMRELPP